MFAKIISEYVQQIVNETCDAIYCKKYIFVII